MSIQKPDTKLFGIVDINNLVSFNITNNKTTFYMKDRATPITLQKNCNEILAETMRVQYAQIMYYQTLWKASIKKHEEYRNTIQKYLKKDR